HRDVAAYLPFDRISRRYFFESDMLFRLNTLRAVVVDIPMDASYGNEVSNLKISKVVGEFFFKHVRNTSKRVFYNYYLRDLSLASFQLPTGLALIAFGLIFGLYKWSLAAAAGVTASAGTVMLSAVPLLVGIELVLAFVGQDIQSVPQRPFLRTSRTLERLGHIELQASEAGAASAVGALSARRGHVRRGQPTTAPARTATDSSLTVPTPEHER
ncbi:MAG: hypothetical protein Q4E06_01570, partial [Lautropia sp.]|nr:hypothetical protein [Lautropia sp.]